MKMIFNSKCHGYCHRMASYYSYLNSFTNTNNLLSVSVCNIFIKGIYHNRCHLPARPINIASRSMSPMSISQTNFNDEQKKRNSFNNRSNWSSNLNRNMSNSNDIGVSLLNSLIKSANGIKSRKSIAIIDKSGTLSYEELVTRASTLSLQIIENISKDNGYNPRNKLNGQRIALLTENDAAYVIGQYATWFAGGISVPLCQQHPPSMIEYFLENSQSSLILVSENMREKISTPAEKFGIPLLEIKRDEHNELINKEEEVSNSHNSSHFVRFGLSSHKTDQPALIVFTSGTTGKPKGVLHTHGSLEAMVSAMVHSWAWTSDDILLHVLPLHHVHGIVNCLLTPLTCGATVFMEPKFDAKRVWDLLTAPLIPNVDRHINLFMAVPTIYTKLIEYYDKNIAMGNSSNLAALFVKTTTINKIRLMVSGSAALPTPVSDRWHEITGHRLLERYGMTEIGMALTNPLIGDRIPGAVGQPFPSVEVRIVKPENDSQSHHDNILAEGNCEGTAVTEGAKGESGELLVKGPSVFREYWDNQKATEEAFTDKGWFKTGDTVAFENGVYYIVGRTSVDIIKSGGYKISALEIERQLLAHPDIADCAVIGLPDATWGQVVAAVLTTKSDDGQISAADLRQWSKDVLPSYQIPQVVKCLDSIPRNVMGKVNKKEMLVQIFPEVLDKK